MISAIRDMLEQMVVAAWNGVIAVAHVAAVVAYTPPVVLGERSALGYPCRRSEVP